MAAQALGILGLILAVVVPPFLPKYFLEILISVMFWAYLGSAWNILGGYGGQFSFGPAAFFGIGAYTSTLLLLRLGVSPWLRMLIRGGPCPLFRVTAVFPSLPSGLR